MYKSKIMEFVSMFDTDPKLDGINKLQKRRKTQPRPTGHGRKRIGQTGQTNSNDSKKQIQRS